VVGEDREDIKVSIEQLNSHPGIQKKCEQLEHAGFKYLQFSSLHGTGIADKIDIPQNTELSYYIGAVYAVACNPVGNYSIDVGSSGRPNLCVNATRVPKNLPLGCSMHMANHGCNPNCRVTPYEPDGWDNDLVLLMLVAMRDIVRGEAVTFPFKGSMWQAHPELPLLAPKGFRLVQCGCDQPCPNGLARLDWIESGNDTSPAETEEWYRGRKMISSTLVTVNILNTRSPINTKQDVSCKSLHTATPDGANDLSQSSTSGIKEFVTQSQGRITLNLSTEQVLKQSPLLKQRVAYSTERTKPEAAKVIRDRRADVETVEFNAQTKLQANRHAPIPTDIFEAEGALSAFDCSSVWGPKSSVSRFERLARPRKYSSIAGWEWVDDILHQFPALGRLTANERIQDGARCTVTHSAQNNVLALPGLHKGSIAPDGPAVRKSKLPVAMETPPGGSMSSKQCLFQHTLLNVGNTCYFNSVLQVVASLPLFVLAIENTPQNQDHADSSYCLAFLKLFIPAIASPTLLPSSVLKWSSVTLGDWQMVQEDWIDFVCRLTIKFDNRYVPGALSDPGDLLEYVL
jgi:hypothetical protein